MRENTSVHRLLRQVLSLCLAVVLTLSVNAAALFGGKEKAQPAEGIPTAQALEIRTYRGIPYHAQFLAAGGEGEDLTFTVEAYVLNNIKTELGSQEVRVGKTHIVKTTHYELNGGVILTCQWKEGTGADNAA